MSPRHTAEGGFTLIEVLLAMVLMLVVTSATLAVFNASERLARDNQNLNESQQQVRAATDGLAQRLRNLASPTDASSAAADRQPLERATANDLVFRSVNSEGPASPANPSNVERYRYCLAAGGDLYVQRQTWSTAAPPIPADPKCPGAGWSEKRVAAQDLVNDARPVFHYQLSPGRRTHSEQTAVNTSDFPITVALRTTLWVDPDTTHLPRETELSTRVFLRNQNRPPGAFLDVKAAGNKLILNASSSYDPEGNALLFQFFDNGVPLKDASNVVIPPSPRALYTYTPAPGPHSLTVEVTDVGNLRAVSTAQTASCNSTTCTSP